MDAENKASIYVEASQKHTMPGVKLLSGLNSGSSVEDMERKLLQLGEYHKDSLDGIHSFVEQLPVCGPTVLRYCWVLIYTPARPMHNS